MTQDITFDALASATYTVTVTDINGCSNTISINMAEPSLLINNISTTDVQCFGDCNGEIQRYCESLLEQRGFPKKFKRFHKTRKI